MISLLDTKRFGFKISKINDIKQSKINEIIKIAKEKKIKLIIVRISSHELDTVHSLEENGFRLMDTQLTYKKEINIIENNNIHSDVDITIATKKDVNELIQIAGKAFDGYGHYAADKRLDSKLCKEIYQDWIKKSCLDTNVADILFISKRKNKITGFLSFKLQNTKGGKYATGVMGGVLPKEHGKGIFQSLIIHGLKWGKEIQIKWEEHNVLINNYPVNRAFSKLGFRIVNSSYTFHKWL